jgi:hypothetical protein
MVSATAKQRGFGSDKYKCVVGLTPAERQHVKAGGTVLFRSSAMSGGNYGTYWRMVKYHLRHGQTREYPHRSYTRHDYMPRVADRETVESVGQEY